MNIGNDHHFIKEEELLSEIEIQDRVIKSYEKAVYENIGQILSLAKMQLFSVDLAKVNESQVKINESGKLIGKAINDLRFITKQLGPKEILAKGFAFAAEFELQRIRYSNGCETGFSQRGHFFRLDSERELLVFIIVQELLLDVMILPASKLILKLHYSPAELKIKIIHQNRDAALLTRDSIKKNKKLNARLQLVGAALTTKSIEDKRIIAITIEK